MAKQPSSSKQSAGKPKSGGAAARHGTTKTGTAGPLTAARGASGPSATGSGMAGPDAAWFVHDRFGMFIHWGLYSLPARHEWVKSQEKISDADYRKYFDHFDPDLFNPTEWARAAKAAGMRYFAITTKHHEGFCLWDSKHTDYKVTNTPYGKDLIGPMVEAFRAEGLHVGFYHSVIDWYHPDFIVGGDPFHPMREDAASIAADKMRDMRRYARYLHAQVRELLTRYGKVDYLFFDFSYADRGGALKGRAGWQSEELLKMCRELQPGILINDRLDLRDVPGGFDLTTPEQFRMRRHAEVDGKPVLWETCQTFSGSWGYHRDEAAWKSPEQLVWMLIDTVSKGGNLLLNVGPTARGTFDDRATARLRGLGDWMRLNSRSIYGCGEAPADLPTPENSLVTYNPATNRAYIHLLHWPVQQFYVDGWLDRIEYAQLLHDASEVKWGPLPSWQQGHEALGAESTILHLPVDKPNVTVPVIEVFLKR